MKSWIHLLLVGAAFGAVFLLGQRSMAPQTLQAQGRGATNPPPPKDPTPATESRTELVYTETGGSASANNGFVAVTGSYGVGTSVLYVLDTVNRQLAVYEARGGSASQRQLVLVGARRVDLDLQIESYNDESEFDYPRLKSLFEKRGEKAGSEPRTGLEVDPGRR